MLQTTLISNLMLVTKNADMASKFRVVCEQTFGIEYRNYDVLQEDMFNLFDKVFIDAGIALQQGDLTANFVNICIVCDKQTKVKELIDLGYRQFIFDYTDVRQLAFHCYQDVYREPVKPKITSGREREFVPVERNVNYDSYLKEYTFNGQVIYLTEKQKETIENLKVRKSTNKERVTLHRLRKKFGEDFFREI